MKVVILAGGLGTRISEESSMRPKPMVDLGGKPILWHIMKLYSAYGLNEFIVCLGYKGYMIKEYFANYFLHMSDVTIDMRDNCTQVHQNKSEPWRVTLVDTGEQTMTGGRLRRVRRFLEKENEFCFTYGDGLSDVSIPELIDFHRAQGSLATLTAVQPPGRFGAVSLKDRKIVGFHEKPEGDGGWINGGFFVLSPKVIDYIDGDASVWESGPLEALAVEGNLSAYLHRGWWHPMDTVRDQCMLEELWLSGRAPWKVWA
jgi:glucose-1-phosphate cytidylyltransferase